jgi:hypothetical protein
MQTLSAEFESAVTNVTIHGEKQKRASAAHTEVRELLEDDRQLRDWGIDTILIGSYADGSLPRQGRGRVPAVQEPLCAP